MKILNIAEVKCVSGGTSKEAERLPEMLQGKSKIHCTTESVLEMQQVVMNSIFGAIIGAMYDNFTSRGVVTGFTIGFYGSLLGNLTASSEIMNCEII